MNGLTRVFLVLLRLAIGWHFLVEGYDKIHSVELGPTETNRPWTSRGYLREASGPAAQHFRSLAGDPDKEALELFGLRPLEAGEDPSKVPPHQRISPALDAAWNEYLLRFTRHYELTEDQVPLAEKKMVQAKDQAARWLAGELPPREVERTFGPLASFKTLESTSQRLQDYRERIAQIDHIMGVKLRAFGRDVEKRNLPALKAEADRLRTELLAELEKPMQETLASLLTPEQQKRGPVLEVAEPMTWRFWQWSQMQWVDTITSYGLTAVGLCLLAGLFTRSACVVGAAFLLLFYLAMPALPWLPESPKAEGHYLYINKNIIEMLALLALATTRSGCWVGLDGLLYFLLPWHWRKRTLAAPPRRMIPAVANR
jgi:uncharacterized membrane protein YphA (DoxX/SURF4 family)